MNPTLKTVLLAAAAVLPAGCGYSTKGYRYQGPSFAPREANCSLEIFTARPRTASRELGVVEFKPRRLGGLPKSEIEAREEAHAYACLAGGNGILITPNQNGRYTKATILRVKK